MMASMSSLVDVQRSVDQAYTLPPRCYSDPEIFSFEQERLFAAGWVSFGRADDLTEPGDYLARTVADTPLVAIQATIDGSGVFANTVTAACVLPDGRGSVRQLACPFHGWVMRWMAV